MRLTTQHALDPPQAPAHAPQGTPAARARPARPGVTAALESIAHHFEGGSQ
jgi:hypothetical protein